MGRDTGEPSSIAQASTAAGNVQPVKADQPATSHAQKQIQSLLRSKPRVTLGGALRILPTLEKRQISELSPNDLSAAHSTALCCFDRSSRPIAWLAHQICERCSSIQALLDGEWSNKDVAALMTDVRSFAAPKSSIHSAILTTALITTDCVSVKCSDGFKRQPPELAFELVQLIIDCTVTEFMVSKDGSGLCRLMHVSCLVRSIVNKSFAPVRVFEVDVTPEHDEVKLHLPRSLATYCGNMLEGVLGDFSSRRYSQPPLLPFTFPPIVWTSGQAPESAMVEIELLSDKLRDDSAEGNVQHIGWNQGEADGRGIHEVLRKSFRDDSCPSRHEWRSAAQKEELGLSEGQEPDVETAAPRVLSIFERALRGRLDASTRGVIITTELSLWFVNEKAPNGQSKLYKKHWRFDTLQTRPASV